VRLTTLPEAHKKWRTSGRFGDFPSCPQQDPGNLKQDPDSPKNGGLPGVWEIELKSFAPRAGRPVTYPQVIHRLLTLGEFGSFTQIPP